MAQIFVDKIQVLDAAVDVTEKDIKSRIEVCKKATSNSDEYKDRIEMYQAHLGQCIKEATRFRKYMFDIQMLMRNLPEEEAYEGAKKLFQQLKVEMSLDVKN